MYEQFDVALENADINLDSKLLEDSKLYLMRHTIDGNSLEILIDVEKTNIYHQVWCNVIENIQPSKKQEYLKLANDLNEHYKNLIVFISEDNTLTARRCYTAGAEQFNPSLYFTIISGLTKILEDKLIPEAMKIKYSY